jgi:hypothetical protein
MEDTACQAECPVNPKACIVINTAKEVRSLPTPTRDGASFETNVSGCFIIGDVSGVPLIKNAVKEGADVIEHIAEELRNASPVPAVEYDVAIIGVGPAGASAAVTATERGLKYVAIEQDKVLSTIQLYPKGKYIFFKPDAKDWSGGIPVAGLGLSKAKYGSSDADPREAVIAETLHSELDSIIRENEPAIRQAFIQRIPESLRAELSPALGEKIVKELKKRVASFLLQHASDDWRDVYTKNFLPLKEQILPQFGKDIVDQLEK